MAVSVILECRYFEMSDTLSLVKTCKYVDGIALGN